MLYPRSLTPNGLEREKGEMARLFPWRHLLLGQGDLFGALAVCSPTFTQRFGPVTTRGEAPAEPCPVASYGAEAQPQVLSLEVRGGPLSAVAQPISTTTALPR
jgi:hypothetical protein